MKLTRLVLLALTLSAVTNAQENLLTDDPESADEDVRQYTVEVIIFRYVEDVATGSEIFVPEKIATPQDPDAVEDESSRDSEPTPDEPRVVTPFEYRRLTRDQLTMDNTWSRLQRLDAYRPLMHFGWTQPAIPEDQTLALQLARFGTVPRGLDGTVQLYLSRFLHLVVDVSFAASESDRARARDMVAAEQTVAAFGDSRSFGRNDDESYDLYEPQYAPLRYRIFEDSIMKNGETRYYDHPKLGVIAKVTRVEEEQTDESGL